MDKGTISAKILSVLSKGLEEAFGESIGYVGVILMFLILLQLILSLLRWQQLKFTLRKQMFVADEEAIRRQYSKEKVVGEIMVSRKGRKLNLNVGIFLTILNLFFLFGVLPIVYTPLNYTYGITDEERLSYIEELQTRGVNITAEVDDYTLIPEIMKYGLMEKTIDTNIGGLNIHATPTLSKPITLIFMCLEVVLQLISIIYSKYKVKKQKVIIEENILTNITTYLPLIVSVVFMYIMPVIVGIYWVLGIIGNIVVTLIFDRYYTKNRVHTCYAKKLQECVSIQKAHEVVTKEYLFEYVEAQTQE